MAGVGLILGALSGGGKGLAASADQDAREAAESRLMQQRAQLEEEKAARIDELRRTRDRQAGVKMGEDIDAATSQMQNQRDAEAINASQGSQVSAEDAAVLRNNPAARKAYGLLDANRQTGLEDRAAAAEKLGYLDAARESRGQLQTELTNQRNEANDKSANRRLDQQEARQKSLDEYNARREGRMDRLASAQLTFQKARAEKEDSRATQIAEREQRAATQSAMKGAEQDIKGLQKEMADPLLAPEQKQVLQRQLEQARREARQYREALSGAGLEGSQVPSKPFDPDNYALGDKGAAKSGGKSVPNPVSDNRAAPQPAAKAQSPQQMAVSGLEAAIGKTVRALTDATNRGDKEEAKRLQELLEEQQRARAKL